MRNPEQASAESDGLISPATSASRADSRASLLPTFVYWPKDQVVAHQVQAELARLCGARDGFKREGDGEEGAFFGEHCVRPAPISLIRVEDMSARIGLTNSLPLSPASQS